MTNQKVIGVNSNDFSDLILDTIFIFKNKKKFIFEFGNILAIPSFTGSVYVADQRISFNKLPENTNMEKYVKEHEKVIDLIIINHSENVEEEDYTVDVYKDKYKGHTVTQDYLEIEFQNGRKEQFLF